MYNKSVSHHPELEVTNIMIASDRLEETLYYRDEGNMNIVVSLFSHDKQEKRVIRFKKVQRDVKSIKSENGDKKNELSSFKAFAGYEQLLQNYFENSNLFTVVPKIVFVDVDLHDLNNFLMRDRPASRRCKVIATNYGLQYRDVAFLPKQIFVNDHFITRSKSSSTICLEIKAKQGYFLDQDGDYPLGIRKCRFCYFQYLKLKNNKIKSISSYCPQDLFSADPPRMNFAIKSLLENPQNNLKIFCDGKMVYNEFMCDDELLLQLYSRIFEDVGNTQRQEILFLNLIRKILLKDFTFCDSTVVISYIGKEVSNVHTRNCTKDSDLRVYRNSILSSVLNAQLLVKENFGQMEVLENLNESQSQCEDREKILQHYRVGSTALDCSLMITFQKLNDGDEKFINRNHLVSIKDHNDKTHHFAVNPTIVDLDLKKDSLDHFQKYKKQCQESKLAFLDFMKKNPQIRK